ncbi:MAG: hypothetical protein QXQ73_00820 [Desulfurococcaceae archaeon]
MLLAKSRVIPLSTLIAVIAGLLVITSLPSDLPYSVANSGAGGLHRLYEELGARVLYSLKDLSGYDAAGYALIVARRGGLENMVGLKSFVERGGLVIAYGSPDYIVGLLRGLGVNATFKGYVRDVMFGVDNRGYIVVNTTSRCGNIVLGNPYTLELEGALENSFAHSSMFSYVDLNGNGFYDLEEPLGQFPLGVSITSGNGHVIIVFAKNFLDNSVLDPNKQFLKCTVEGRPVLIDQSEVAGNPFELLRLVLYKQDGHAYITLMLAFILALVAYFASWK